MGDVQMRLVQVVLVRENNIQALVPQKSSVFPHPLITYVADKTVDIKRFYKTIFTE